MVVVGGGIVECVDGFESGRVRIIEGGGMGGGS